MDKTVLLIDDEKPTLNMFRLMLSAYGYSSLTAEDGEEGLEIFAAKRPPLVITDIKMPGLNGIEVLKRIKALDHRTEVIVITGHGDMDLAIEALNNDATDFINKPVHRHALEQALKRAGERIALVRGKEEEVTVQDHGTAAVILLKGNINSHSEPFLAAAFDQAAAMGKPLIVLHFDESASVNGAGIAILTQTLTRGRDQKLALAISGLSENFRKVFEIIGITKLVRLYDTIDAAVAERR